LTPSSQVYVATRYFVVVGILAPVAVAPEIDDAALVSFPLADSELGLTAGPTRIYLRADPDQVGAVAAVLPFTASPAAPEAVEVRRPSDILVARLAARAAFVGLFLALGGVALVVGGVGIANIMVISVLRAAQRDRTAPRARRSSPARRRPVRPRSHHARRAGRRRRNRAGLPGHRDRGARGRQPGDGSVEAPLAGIGAALAIGVLAGLYPAARAARLAPAAALRTI
jgi:putative ABC transport system permease protein